MMDAGVPLKSAVAGVAMGLVLEEDGSYGILTDILGDEDHLGLFVADAMGHGVAAGLLTVVNATTQEPIKINQQKKINEALKQVLPSWFNYLFKLNYWILFHFVFVHQFLFL
mgnify:CR=1 FL=1